MKKLTTQQKKAKLKRKLDKMIQELGRATYTKCMVCNKPMTVLHHYFPKSMAGILRYEWENLIPLCHGCHMQHHNGNPTIHEKINLIKGEKWRNDLEAKKRQYFNDTLGYYQDLEIKIKTISKNTGLLKPYKV